MYFFFKKIIFIILFDLASILSQYSVDAIERCTKSFFTILYCMFPCNVLSRLQNILSNPNQEYKDYLNDSNINSKIEFEKGIDEFELKNIK